jgi:hypothetical protein
MKIYSVGTLIRIFKSYLFYAYLYLLYFAKEYGIYQNVIKSVVVDKEKEFIEKRTKQFQEVLNIINNDNKKNEYNQNINMLFYGKKAYDEYMKQDNELEKEWKTRILFEYTPRGNISMYYDPYKMGFAYQSDQKTISYEILNACAMKYVKVFRCIDFFMDESNILDYQNTLIPLHYPFEKKPRNKVNEIDKTIDGPFIKRKIIESKEQQEQEREKNKNKFLYIGKLSNSSFLNIPLKKKNELGFFRSALLDGLQQNSEVQSQRLSYKDFKNNFTS